jgi:serine/threonine protein phosphatase PrpC
MGTTVVAALVAGDRITLVSVGDSRIYRLRTARSSS